MKQVYLRDIFKEASISDSTSIIVESPDPLSPTPSISSAMNTEDDPADQELAAADIQMKYSYTFDYLHSLSKKAIKIKSLCALKLIDALPNKPKHSII